MNPYLQFVESVLAGVESARGISVSGKTEPIQSQSKVLLFSPHPDDECIFGAMPFRLTRELGMQVINIPVTFGSNVDRQAGRAKELKDACNYLGWEIHQEKNSFDSLEVSDVVNILKTFQPKIIFFPHSKDWNSRHISTHFLIIDALKQMGSDFKCTTVETEFWGAMDDPNIAVESDVATVAELVAATSLHVEEVARNPYHLLLPAWMQDNVRRGAELVGGQGGAAPDFPFCTLYRLRKWQNGELIDVVENGTPIPMGADNLKKLLGN
jgi:LmbE family N-acetylglucosaminyl deacetylase